MIHKDSKKDFIVESFCKLKDKYKNPQILILFIEFDEILVHESDSFNHKITYLYGFLTYIFFKERVN